ncbi:MAG: hypothetical protein WC928_01515 [Patescibacteria group bacterium]|jgi:hypothetical protein
MNSNFFIYLGKVLAQFLLEVVYFPLWWYSVGLVRLVKVLLKFLGERWLVIGAGVWLKNLFVPMYGQVDFASRAISFFIRLIQIFFRFVFYIFFILFSFFILFLWTVLPPVIVSLIINLAIK